ncbi:MAG TPA: hypothetical protein VM308_00285 [Sphingomicrobium sp.]|nr:hypothetical protein [Sphingomicrobium sp.]
MSARTEELDMFPLGTIFRRTLPLGFASILMLSLILGAWDTDQWSGVPVNRIVAFASIVFVLGLLAAVLMEWESRRERRGWTVTLSEELISIADEKGTRTELPTSSIHVVVAVASQTAWRNDLDIALFDHCDEPLISFPLVAVGGDAFIELLSCKRGFDAAAFAAAKASCRSTGHAIWVAD